MAKEVATTDVKNFAIMKADEAAIREVISANIGQGQMSAFDLDRIRVPAGGGQAWEVPTLEGISAEPFIDAVIVHWREPRSYWSKPLGDNGGGSPPDCSSPNSVAGYGTPGGDCNICPLSKFGTADTKSKRGQACKQMRFLFIARPKNLLPAIIVVPPSSLKNVRGYFLRLASEGVIYHSVVTRFILAKAKSAEGIAYSQIIPQVASRLSADEVTRIQSYAASVRHAFDSVTVRPEDARE